MVINPIRRRWLATITPVICLLLLLVVGEGQTWGQRPEFSILPGLQGFESSNADDSPQISVSARLAINPQSRTGLLSVRADVGGGWHIYSITQPPGGPLRTQIKLNLPTGLRLTGQFQPDVPPEIRPPEIFKVNAEEHHKPVTWTAPVAADPGVDLAGLTVSGYLQGQICLEQCVLLDKEQTSFRAQAQLTSDVVSSGNGETTSSPPAPQSPSDEEASSNAEPPSAAAPEPSPTDLESGTDGGPGSLDSSDAQSDSATVLDQIPAETPKFSLPAVLLLAFVGGLILNFMPCVLPVIGLKILAFVEQAGEDRRRVFWLNVWYSLGIVAVFMVLAAFAASLNWGWGDQFKDERFSIGLTLVVFIMALSFLGVWEIPIPGFAINRGAQQLAEREGMSGAFFKGILATLLATPCSAPGISTGLAWCLGKPPALIYLVFFAMGIGMSFPYLVLGVRPELLRFLPRPGKWMETFKQAMGFVLMATVVYLLTIIRPESIIPTIALLFGAWAGCWWIGRIPFVAELPVRLRAYAVAVTITIAVGAYAFAGHFPVGDMTVWGLRGMMAYRLGDAEQVEYELPWEAFSVAKLEELLEARQTVMVDFTADWCATCKWLEQRVLNTQPIYESISRLGIKTLKADYDQPEVKQLARRLGRSGIPILVIFPHGDPSRPVLLPTNYSRGQLLDALNEIEMSDAAIASR